MDLIDLYRAAAQTALDEGVRTEAELLAWIRSNVRYRSDTEFFVYLGIATEFFDLRARAQGYESAVHLAFEQARRKIQRKSR